ncbi:T6SS phospholipase effector Tle1-like catalytic domain-containing protein [Sungkyunkwania multivorans]|uniref:T6SS phospholipase effector Tle1-like catalytic domain-containing protein n=1 Tax=Sungkyunkwania multivorans TaxID=1173618 RepID=A0ABW3D5I6_9FLAO
MPELGLEATPANGQETRNALSGVDVSTSKVHVCDADFQELVPDDSAYFTVGVFFDGTLNNAANTQARLEYENKQAGRPYDRDQAKVYNTWYTFQKSGSYDNDFSNVARMQRAYEEIIEDDNYQIPIYIEGIGTEDHESDSGILGAAQGLGATGVRAKVLKGCEEVVDVIKQKQVEKISCLRIDTYGFSRGAAAARNFVFEIKKNKGDFKKMGGGRARTKIYHQVPNGYLGELLEENGIEVNMVQVRFVGLYDTVASLGINHDNDTRELNLDAVRKANHTFQIAADDEHRVNFRLTNINSAGSKGVQKELPGVHSDIGGGYTDNSNEEVTLNYANTIFGVPELRRQRQRLIEEGWYLEDEITAGWLSKELTAKRTGIRNTYSHIPLHIMVQYSITKQLAYDLGLIQDQFSIEGDELTQAKSRVDDYVFYGGAKFSYDNIADREIIRKLRNRYFHFSAHYDDKVVGLIAPHKPNFIDGERTRVIQNG